MLGDVLAAVWERPAGAGEGGRRPGRRLGLIAAADLAACAEEATFAFTEVDRAIPAVISATVLPRLHPRAAAELYLTGETFDGRRAAQVGLVTAAVPAAELDGAVAGYCAALVKGAPRALGGAEQLLRRPLTRPAPGDRRAGHPVDRLLPLRGGTRGSAGVQGETARPLGAGRELTPTAETPPRRRGTFSTAASTPLGRRWAVRFGGAVAGHKPD
jgi:hypothetical protein